jgi:hypothetical protein
MPELFDIARRAEEIAGVQQELSHIKDWIEMARRDALDARTAGESS